MLGSQAINRALSDSPEFRQRASYPRRAGPRGSTRWITEPHLRKKIRDLNELVEANILSAPSWPVKAIGRRDVTISSASYWNRTAPPRGASADGVKTQLIGSQQQVLDAGVR